MRSDNIRLGFSHRLKEMMEERGLTQMQLATMTGVAQSRVSQWRNADAMPQPRVARSLADALGVMHEWLVNGTGPKEPKEASSFQLRTAAAIGKKLKEKGMDARTAQTVFEVSESVLNEQPPGYGSDWMQRAIDAEKRAVMAERQLANLKTTLQKITQTINLPNHP